MMIWIIIIIVCLLSVLMTRKESFSTDNKEDMDFVRAIQRFVTPVTSFEDYIDFLEKNNNTYSKLEDFKTFVILQNLKKIGELSVDNIAKFMTD